MTRTPDASADTEYQRLRLLALLHDNAIDAAIDAGLMAFTCDPDEPRDVPLATLQIQLRDAWNARERYQARAARLQRIERERQTRRLAAATTTPAAVDATASTTSTPPPPSPASSPALPPAVAAALARAKARAQERSPQ